MANPPRRRPATDQGPHVGGRTPGRPTPRDDVSALSTLTGDPQFDAVDEDVIDGRESSGVLGAFDSSLLFGESPPCRDRSSTTRGHHAAVVPKSSAPRPPERGCHSETVDRVQDDWRVYRYDAGWNDPRVLLKIGKTGYEQLVVLDEFYQSDSHVEDTIAWLGRTGKPEGTIFAEHEPAEIDKFKKAGHSVEKAEKSIDAGIAEVRKRLKPAGNSLAEASDLRALTWDGIREQQKKRQKRAEQAAENPRVGLFVSDRCQLHDSGVSGLQRGARRDEYRRGPLSRQSQICVYGSGGRLVGCDSNDGRLGSEHTEPSAG